MRYFSTFSGIGGFELGIQQAYETLCNAHGSEVGGGKADKERNKGQRFQPSARKDVGATKRPVSERDNNISNKRPLCVGYSEIDKYASAIYQSHFPTHHNYGDITKIVAEELPDFDLLVGGFPCQAFSIAGKRRGFEDTRGTMFFELARILRAKQPRLFVFENVKGLLSHDNGNTFRTIIAAVTELGYDCQWQVLNSKNHGVPQNRERVFIVGHLRGTSRPQVFPLNGTSKNDINTRGLYEGNKGRVSQSEEGQEKIEYTRDTYNEKIGESPLHERSSQTSIRRLTPKECERLQGFPDGWTENGLSDTMEICVNINPAIEKQLLQSATVSSITSDGSGMVIPISQNESKEPVNIVLHELLLEDGATSTINRGNAIATLFNRKGTSLNAAQLKVSLTSEKMVEKSTCKLWKVSLVGHYEKERLSTILTWINETMQSITSISARTDESIIGVIILLNTQELNYSNGESLCLKVGNIESISDTQRYKTLGNAVTVNVIRDIMMKIL